MLSSLLFYSSFSFIIIIIIVKVTILLAVLFVLAAADPENYTAKRGKSTNTCVEASSLNEVEKCDNQPCTFERLKGVVESHKAGKLLNSLHQSV